MKKAINLITFGFVICFLLTGCKSSDYKVAMQLYANKEYSEAASSFEVLGDYKDSAEMVKNSKYAEAVLLKESGDYDGAINLFSELGDYNDSVEMLAETRRDKRNAKYGNVISQLKECHWFFNGGNDSTLKWLSFSDDSVTTCSASFDGNGRHSGASKTCNYDIDDTTISIIDINGSVQTISYKQENGMLILGDYECYSQYQIAEGLKGYWKCHTSDYIAALGIKTEEEYNVYISDGKIKHESAALAMNSTNGEYYYYGPYEGTFTLGDGTFSTNMEHGNEFFFNVIRRKPVLLRYDHVFTTTNGLPGKNGYRNAFK